MLSLCKNIPTLVFWSCFSPSPRWRPLQGFWFKDYGLCFAALCTSESVSRRTLSAMKILLKLELSNLVSTHCTSFDMKQSLETGQ